MNPGLHSLDLHRIDSTCLRQSLYLLGDEGVVYSEAQNRFAGLDAAGVSAYRAFDAGVSVQDLRECRDHGGFSSPPEDDLESIHALSQGIFPVENSRVEWPLLDHPISANIEIHGLPVLLEYPAGPLEDLCRDYFRNCPTTTRPARCHLHARHEDYGWTICVNGRALLSQLRNEQIGLGFLHAARSLLYAEAEYDVAFHAAMVADDERGVLLCAPREAGKSTLTASLVAQGFDLMTDEPALLHLDTSSVSPLGLPVSLKEGSWTVLRHEWPQLNGAPVHVRSDGVQLRLLHPPQARLSTRPRRLTHIVFPEYNPSSETQVELLSPFRALGLLNEGGMILAGHIDRDKFEIFLRLVCITPAYAMQYASLKEAVQIVHEISIES
jgi:hypothetical protein